MTSAGGPPIPISFGWAMAANTPLKRKKQNTHGGGIRDPLVISWPNGLGREGGLRHQFAHVSTTRSRPCWRCPVSNRPPR